MKQTLKQIALVVLSMFVSVTMFAQMTTSSMSGKVYDDQGPLPGAVISLVHVPSGTQYHAVSNADGIYRLLNIRAGGPFEIKVQMMGYKTESYSDITASLGEETVVDVFMEPDVEKLAEAVIIADDELSNMRIDRAGSVTTVDSKAISTLPTVSRSMNDVMSLTPQAAVTTSGLAVGGGNYRQSYVTVDGAAFNNAFGIGSNLPAGGTPISLDALEQMSVSITPYDVRNSGFTGGSIQAVTKSGTNQFKVSVYNYFKNDALQGKKVSDYDPLVLSSMLQNTTGISVGAPIVKNKLFIFVNFEYDIDNNPGQTALARPAGVEMEGQYHRPTETRMDLMREYLKNNYNYDPGEYQGYSFNTPDWKLMARVDWNINDNNHFNFRFSKTANKYQTSPSSSVSPFGSTALYNRNSYGRTSKYALYYQNACYYQEQNFTSYAGELNSRFFDGKGSNLLRVAYSHQYEPRSYNSELFPTVDILENEGDTRAVYTTFGIDPFTYGNLRDVSTWTATDEFSYTAGKHNLLAGIQFESNNAKNGYMQMGAGYYLYASWEDFVAASTGAGAAPLAFAITHGNNDELNQEFPYLKNSKWSFYLQDQIEFSNRFKFTAGIRFELPTYPSMDFNENKEFTQLFQKEGWKTSNVPNAYLALSPRIGFNWDVLGERKLVLRGGSGVYVGSLPMVWLVSSVGNSNVMQSQVLLSGDDPDLAGKMNHFRTDITDMLSDYYGGTFKKQDLPAPTATTVIDKNLKLPTTWKTSLAADVKLPGGIDASVEGIYNKDIYSVIVSKEGMVKTTQQLPGEPQERSKYSNDPTKKNSAGKAVNPYVIKNSDENGYYFSITAKLEKKFKNLALMAAYTYSKSIGVNDGLGDQLTSAWSTNTYSINGSNETTLSYSSYVAPNRLIGSASWTIPEGKRTATILGLFYEGYNYGYVGEKASYTRWNYTMKTNITGEGGAYNLIYIPTTAELAQMPFESEANKVAFEQRIQSDEYLSSHRGQYAERGGCIMPWYNRVNFKIAQDFYIGAGERKHNVQVGLDIKNIMNMFNSNWGNVQSLNNQEILNYSNGKYTYLENSCTFSPLATTASTWQMLLSVRYSF